MADSSKRSRSINLLRIARILFDATDGDDPQHGMATREILSSLDDKGVGVDKKTVRANIRALQEFFEELDSDALPFAIGSPDGKGGCASTVAMLERPFTFEELATIVAALESARFLPETQKDELVQKVKLLGSVHQRDALEGFVSTGHGIHMDNYAVYDNLFILNQALREKRRVRYRYHRRVIGKRTPVGIFDDWIMTVTPLGLAYIDGFCYLAAYYGHGKVFCYRVDRIDDLEIVDEPSEENQVTRSFSLEDYVRTQFGAWMGDPVRVMLLVNNTSLDAVYDRFGDVNVIEAKRRRPKGAREGEQWASVTVEVIPGPPFYGWVAGFGRNMRIESPRWVVNEFRECLAEETSNTMEVYHGR